MSWLAQSLANSLRLGGDETDKDENDVKSDGISESSNMKHETVREQNDRIQSVSPFSSPEEVAQARGVGEDLTELKQTLTRQLWGVANFLAPPPSGGSFDDSGRNSCVDRSASNLEQSGPSNCSESDDLGQPTMLRSDVAEIREEISRGLLGISTMASNYFPFGFEKKEPENAEENERGERFEEEVEVEEEIEVDAVGITDEVVAFARNIAMHPETWIDFPLDPDEDLDGFHMSEAQRHHALFIEHLAPRLAALRIELCPFHMSESFFWKVYFVLVHSRLSKHDGEMLSTPEVVAVRTLWMQELQKQAKSSTNWFGNALSSNTNHNPPLHHPFSSARSYAPPEFLSPNIYSFKPPSIKRAGHKTVRHSVVTEEVPCVDKAVIVEESICMSETKDLEITPSSKIQVSNSEDDDDDWLDEEISEFDGHGKMPICLVNEDNISFSDLEDEDDNCDVPAKSETGVSKDSETLRT